jgi:hypothetical protein
LPPPSSPPTRVKRRTGTCRRRLPRQNAVSAASLIRPKRIAGGLGRTIVSRTMASPESKQRIKRLRRSGES